jgi:hypothetical protein
MRTTSDRHVLYQRHTDAGKLVGGEALMTVSSYVPSAETDGRHRPGAAALQYWNESVWFPMYDPRTDIGIVFRSGIYPKWGAGSSNCFLSIVHEGRIVLTLSDQRAPLPSDDPTRIVTDSGLSIEWEEPLHSFRLRFSLGSHAFDLHWKGMGPPYLYPTMEGQPADMVPRHIEQGGRATGTVRLGGRDFAFDGYAHRDHTYGGERDWNHFYRWNYLSGEFDQFWFNAVRIKFHADMDWLRIGCIWDGARLLALHDVSMRVQTADGGTRLVAAEATLTDELGRAHHIASGRICGVAPVLIWNTWLKDFLVEYRMNGRIGYGVFEHGYREGDRLDVFT